MSYSARTHSHCPHQWWKTLTLFLAIDFLMAGTLYCIVLCNFITRGAGEMYFIWSSFFPHSDLWEPPHLAYSVHYILLCVNLLMVWGWVMWKVICPRILFQLFNFGISYRVPQRPVLYKHWKFEGIPLESQNYHCKNSLILDHRQGRFLKIGKVNLQCSF